MPKLTLEFINRNFLKYCSDKYFSNKSARRFHNSIDDESLKFHMRINFRIGENNTIKNLMYYSVIPWMEPINKYSMWYLIKKSRINIHDVSRHKWHVTIINIFTKIINDNYMKISRTRDKKMNFIFDII